MPAVADLRSLLGTEDVSVTNVLMLFATVEQSVKKYDEADAHISKL